MVTSYSAVIPLFTQFSRTHDVLTEFMIRKKWNVIKHHLLPTAWEARFTHGTGGRTIGVNSEMDALPGVGHACGHNLIAMTGVAIALAIADALEKFDVPGTVVLLGTPGMSQYVGSASRLNRDVIMTS